MTKSAHNFKRNVNITRCSDFGLLLRLIMKEDAVYICTHKKQTSFIITPPSRARTTAGHAERMEAQCFERILGFKFAPDLKGNTSIRSIAKATGSMNGSLDCSTKFLTLHALLYR